TSSAESFHRWRARCGLSAGAPKLRLLRRPLTLTRYEHPGLGALTRGLPYSRSLQGRATLPLPILLNSFYFDSAHSVTFREPLIMTANIPEAAQWAAMVGARLRLLQASFADAETAERREYLEEEVEDGIREVPAGRRAAYLEALAER